MTPAHVKFVRQGVLFIIGVAALVIEIVNASILNNEPHSAVIVLGCTLCGVGVTDFAAGRMK